MTPQEHYDQTWKSLERIEEMVTDIQRDVSQIKLRDERWEEQAINCTAEKLKTAVWSTD